ncbi:MAG: phytase [Gemmatimonadota bacterium]|nr:MAG: phytase [Gemmatimonadota bacterium]
MVLRCLSPALQRLGLVLPLVIVAALGGCRDTGQPNNPSGDPQVTAVLLSPESATLAPGVTQQFEARGARNVGDTIAVYVDYTATGGTITPNGLYTAGAVLGAYQVTGTHRPTGLAGTAEVTITEPPPPGGTVTVQATVETDPSHHSGDTADDMAIWIHPTDPSLSLVIGDDKDGGLMVWGLDGRELQYVDGTNYNNLDLRYNFPLVGQFSGGAAHQTVALVGVGDELGEQIDLFKVNPSTRRLESAGSIDTNGFVPYGSCMYHSPNSGKYYYFVNDRSGVVQQWELGDGGGAVTGAMVRQFDVGSQTEGCVADDHLGYFYIGEEDVGIWKYGAEPDAGSARTQVDETGAGGNLDADVEGLSLYYAGETTGYLLAASQGDSRVVIYTRESANTLVGKLKVQGSGNIDSVSGIDGLDVTNFPLSAGFSQGLLAVHDGNNTGASASNVKYVPWASVAAALGLTVNTSYDPRTVGQ